MKGLAVTTLASGKSLSYSSTLAQTQALGPRNTRVTDLDATSRVTVTASVSTVVL